MRVQNEIGMRLIGALLAAGLAGPAAGSLPAEIVGEPIRRVFDGQSDDLLSAGLGAEGLRGPAPGFADPANPTALELRRRAIWNNYRSLADLSAAGGFGRFSGPRGDERIAGVEYLAAVRKPGGTGITTVMLQIPAQFDPARPCLVAVASSGSRGVYGALPTAGEWGLRKACAVVHTDKGTGTGFHDLDSGTAFRIDLTPTRDTGDPLVTWRAKETTALAEWRRTHPHRVAVRHAHDGENPERDWGLYLLQAIKAGFVLLQQEFPATDTRPAITRAGTTVIASGVSNGGGTVLRAVEADNEHLLDGAVVSEPNVSVAGTLALFDHALMHYLLQPAAVLAPPEDVAMSSILATQRKGLEAWTARLAELGLVSGETLAERARDARLQLETAGVLGVAQDGGIANVAFGLWPAIAEAYAATYARLGPSESPCGLSYAAMDAQFRARALSVEELARLAADSAGVPPTGGLQLVDDAGRFASFGSIEHVLCMREFAAQSPRLRAGIEETLANGRVRDRPVIIVHGRRDALIPVNYSSRAWYALHRSQGGRTARYYEVEHGHHYDAFNALPGWGARFVPMQPQLLAAMDLMYGHLTAGRRLPPSQVVRSRPRALVDGLPEPVAMENLGAIRLKPGADAIRFKRNALIVPE